MKILHFTHPEKPEYVYLKSDDNQDPDDNFCNPGYTLGNVVEYEHVSGSEISLPLDRELVSDE